jgi:glycosyltransferase involved in cell wall biosynthesis
MRVWLITIGEPLPIDSNGSMRLYRTGILAGMLAKNDVEVVWWTSTFDHVRKCHRFFEDTSIFLESGVHIKLMHGCGYRRNISITRLIDHAILAVKFSIQARKMESPDVILCSLPTLELSLAAVHFGSIRKIPVIIDIRDLWPDIFYEVAPRWLRPLLKIALVPMLFQANAACKKAYAITGNSPGFVKWGIDRAKRKPTNLDRYFPFGYEIPILSQSEEKSASQFWAKYDIVYADVELTICFFGAFNNQFNLETVVDAALLLQLEGFIVRFVLCGDGENLEALKTRAKGSRHIIFPGWVGRAEIWKLMALSDLGIAPYKNHVGFFQNLPNKPIEYMAGGLPILSGLHGYLEDFLKKNECGVNYECTNPVELRDVIKNLLSDRKQISAMSKNARIAFAKHFSAEIVYMEMIEYLRDIVEIQIKNKAIKETY